MTRGRCGSLLLHRKGLIAPKSLSETWNAFARDIRYSTRVLCFPDCGCYGGPVRLRIKAKAKLVHLGPCPPPPRSA